MISDQAVEAAFEAFYSKCDVDFDAAHAIVAALTAAAPFIAAQAWDEGFDKGAAWGDWAAAPINPEPDSTNPYRSGK